MKLYFHPLSPHGRRVRLTAAELGVEFDEEKIVDLSAGEQQSPDFLGINPNGMIPVLVDRDLALCESRAIMHYLASKKPGSGLQGSTETERADILRWQFWDSAHFGPPVDTLLWERVLKGLLGDGEPDDESVARALDIYRRFAGVLDTTLRSQRYLVGDRLTLADLTVAATLTWADPIGLPLDDTPQVAGWLGAIAKRPSWVETQPQL